jgi:tetratricopeptide (TPR) repeat protein/energy-coupling factor transporter ATP-binding protein EcfA2
MDQEGISNPFPGLRPFEPDEDHLFFGREKQIDELLRRLRGTRFLAVVGASGSGKSSLVRCGLIPALQGGFMAGAGSGWRIAILRPGEDPIGHMADSLSVPECLGTGDEPADMRRAFVEATLRRSTLGLVEAVRLARVPAHENILVVVDQFEELFRFRRNRPGADDEAAAFVRMLLEAAREDALPIYVVLTMRSDFIGDCMQYAGLPEAVNNGIYLVPRMSRDELRLAISGPVAVAGGQIAPRLTVRLLNEVGDNADQLPILQHALMRTWHYWRSHRRADEPIDMADYEAIGTMQRALSLHAEEAWAEAGSEAARRIAERLFKALTDSFTDPRGVRRPTAVAELAAVCEGSEADVTRVLELFRRAGRSFLMPPADVPLNSRSVVDLSHESLMRQWDRLAAWADRERISAERYVRLSRAAAWNAEGSAGLWRDPELELGLQWRSENRPTAAWAARYDPAFDRAMAFLDRSRQERDALIAERERERRGKLRQARWAAGILATMLLIAVVLGVLAASEGNRAEKNLQTANDVVDKLLLNAGGDPGRDAPFTPEAEAFRSNLLDQAREYLSGFTKQNPNSREFKGEMAEAHRRLGDIHRVLQQNPEAAAEYNIAIRQFGDLVRDNPANPDYRDKEADAYNWLGEAEPAQQDGYAQAERAYGAAIPLQEELYRRYPASLRYRQMLARTHDNLGILRMPIEHTRAEADYREAIRILEPLTDPQSRRELAHAYNNLAILLDEHMNRPEMARPYYERAIGIEEPMLAREPGNREYQFDLAKFYNSLAILLFGQRDFEDSSSYNDKAARLFDELARPALTFTMELAHTHTLRGRALWIDGRFGAAEKEDRLAITLFEGAAPSGAAKDNAEFHMRYGDALFQLATLLAEEKNPGGARALLSKAAEQHAAPGSETRLASDYLSLARANLELGAADQARQALDKLFATIPRLPEPERTQLGAEARKLQSKTNIQ